MPICPFAEWKPISGPSGAYTGGPFKIVHHTTEGGSATGAMDEFKKNKSDPHFTVDDTKIYQHIDSGVSARALRNIANQPPQTNRDSAVQIEVVGFAGKRKSPKTLLNVARLCRWIEAEHGVLKIWPNGLPKPSINGGDPGGHNRNAQTWDNKSGHYGHCHVPENVHWDPGYTADEVTLIMEASFDANGKVLRNDELAAHYPEIFATAPVDAAGGFVSDIPAHGSPPG